MVGIFMYFEKYIYAHINFYMYTYMRIYICVFTYTYVQWCLYNLETNQMEPGTISKNNVIVAGLPYLD